MLVFFFFFVVNYYLKIKFRFYVVIVLAMRRRIRGILMSGKQFSLDSRMDLVQVCTLYYFIQKKIKFSYHYSKKSLK